MHIVCAVLYVCVHVCERDEQFCYTPLIVSKRYACFVHKDSPRQDSPRLFTMRLVDKTLQDKNLQDSPRWDSTSQDSPRWDSARQESSRLDKMKLSKTRVHSNELKTLQPDLYKAPGYQHITAYSESLVNWPPIPSSSELRVWLDFEWILTHYDEFSWKVGGRICMNIADEHAVDNSEQPEGRGTQGNLRLKHKHYVPMCTQECVEAQWVCQGRAHMYVSHKKHRSARK